MMPDEPHFTRTRGARVELAAIALNALRLLPGVPDAFGHPTLVARCRVFPSLYGYSPSIKEAVDPALPRCISMHHQMEPEGWLCLLSCDCGSRMERLVQARDIVGTTSEVDDADWLLSGIHELFQKRAVKVWLNDHSSCRRSHEMKVHEALDPDMLSVLTQWVLLRQDEQRKTGRAIPYLALFVSRGIGYDIPKVPLSTVYPPQLSWAQASSLGRFALRTWLRMHSATASAVALWMPESATHPRRDYDPTLTHFDSLLPHWLTFATLDHTTAFRFATHTATGSDSLIPIEAAWRSPNTELSVAGLLLQRRHTSPVRP